MATTEEFVGKVMGDTVGLTNTVLAWMGDELGLWKELAARGPTTSVDLAAKMGLAERPVREWLHAMTAAGYLVHVGEAKTFQLPPEHAPVLAQESGPVFFSGVHQEILGPAAFDDAFRTYTRRWAFKHPTPVDFFRTMEDVSGRRLDWFSERLHRLFDLASAE